MGGLADRRPFLEQRARILQGIRAFFIDRGYLEVETPHRIPANAPEAHIDPVACAGGYLHTSPEVAMKRLLAAGYPRLFQLCRCWRDGERGGRHLPEFTLLEWYAADSDYRDLMITCEDLLRVLVPTGTLLRQGRSIDLVGDFTRLTVDDAYRTLAGTTVEEALAQERFDELMAVTIEPQLGWERPLFLHDYPAALGALARKRADDPRWAERVEFYVAGLELANGFSELTDAVEQRQRFLEEQHTRTVAGKPPLPLPEPFLAELPQLSPCAGMALGLDRLVMLLTGADRIDQVVAFTPEEL